MLMQVLRHRYSIFGVFMTVPTGFIRGLATRAVLVDEDEEAESDSEAGDDVAIANTPIAAPIVAQKKKGAAKGAMAGAEAGGDNGGRGMILDVEDPDGADVPIKPVSRQGNEAPVHGTCPVRI